MPTQSHETRENIGRCRAAREAKRAGQAWIREANAEARAERSPEEQLARLNRMLGRGKGAVKERARLKAEVEARRKAQ